ncbi:hypothetical protein EQV77_11375 [Halobacillus fulvus]|nr:hypothetical protein EQV77_11375 [Halobacillus fulvus]
MTFEHKDVKGEVIPSFEDGVQIAQKNEFETSDVMLFILPASQAYQPLFIAMTDEVEHATRFDTILGRLK